LAVFDKKYVLCLSLDEDFSEKINNRYVLGAKYSELTIDEIIEDFVAKVSKNILTERFNCFLSPAQVHYLQSQSLSKNINMSEYVRELIDRDRKG
jgi:3-methyladenine DNA glycosylase/8-oxoguanine DNA glycosylase